MAIRVVVILGIAFFAIDEFYLKNKTPEPTAEEIQAKLAKSKKNKKNRELDAKNKAEQNAKNEASADDKKTAEKSDNGKVDSAGDAPVDPPVENINVMEKSQTVEPETLDQKIDKISETIPAEPTPKIEKVEEVKEVVKDPIIKMEEKPEVTKNSGINSDSNVIEEIKIPSQGKSSENTMTSKIVETLVETPPPAYDQLGRGLVYNCKDKYWACVDRSAYLTCNKNFKYNESVGKSKECVVQAIYATDEDCAKIQKYNVSVSQSTDFCKN